MLKLFALKHASSHSSHTFSPNVEVLNEGRCLWIVAAHVSEKKKGFISYFLFHKRIIV